MRSLFSQCALLLLLVNCASASKDLEPSNTDSEFRSYDLTAGLQCEPSIGLYECLKEAEHAAAKENNVQLTRTGGALCVSAQDMAKTCLQEEAGLRYAFIDRLNNHLIFAEIEGVEGYSVLLVNEATGRQSRIDNRPLFSPDGRFFATVSYDTDAGYVPNRVAIWDTTSGELIYQVNQFPLGVGPTEIRWSAPERLQVIHSQTSFSPDGDKSPAAFQVWKGEGSGWHDNYRK